MLLSLLFLCFLTHSNLRFPSRRGLPFGPSQIGFGLCFSPFRVTGLGLSPLRSSVLFASGVLCVSFSPGGFFFLSSLSRSVLLPSGPFLVPPGSCGFRPFWLFLGVVPRFLSSVSPFFQFSVPMLLTSSPPFCWWFSLSPFLGSSSSLLPCFRLRLLRSVACPVLGLPSMAGSCPFSFSVRLPSTMRCFLVAFLPYGFLPSRPLFRCVFPFHPSGFSASLCFRSFPLGSSVLLSALSSSLFHHWAFVFLARSRFLVFSLLFLLSAFVSALLQVVLSHVLPLPVWFISFGRCPMLFLLWCFLSLPCVPVFSRVACVFFAPRFLGSFLVWLLVSLRSLRSGVFLLFRFCWGFLVFF